MDWILPDETAARKSLSHPVARPSQLPAPRTSSSDPTLDAARVVAAKLVPKGSLEAAAIAFPDAKAASVTLTTPGGETYQISIQRLPRTITVGELTGPNRGDLSKLSTGSQLLEISGSGFAQAVLVRSSGLAITVTALSMGLDADADPVKLGQVVADIADADELERLVS
jgi:hypothetical protein